MERCRILYFIHTKRIHDIYHRITRYYTYGWSEQQNPGGSFSELHYTIQVRLALQEMDVVLRDELGVILLRDWQDRHTSTSDHEEGYRSTRVQSLCRRRMSI